MVLDFVVKISCNPFFQKNLSLTNIKYIFVFLKYDVSTIAGKGH